jgi:hypothetical protein
MDKVQKPNNSEASSRTYGTWRFITAFTRARHSSLPWGKSYQFTHSSFYFFRVLSSSLSLASGLLLSDVPAETHINFRSIPCVIPAPTILDFIVLIILSEEQCINYECSQLTSACLPLLLPASNQIFSKHFLRHLEIVFFAKGQVTHP